MKTIICHFDGCCEPYNPGGTIGIGAIVNIDGVNVLEYSNSKPKHPDNTNNIAEYSAFAQVLAYIINNNLQNEDIVIRGDSQLVVKQMTGEWQIKNGAYVSLANRCAKALTEKFERMPTIEWIPREKNDECDRLSKGHLIKNGIKITERKK